METLKLSGNMIAVPMDKPVSGAQSPITAVESCEVLGQTVRAGDVFLDFANTSLLAGDSREGVPVKLTHIFMVKREDKEPRMEFVFEVPVTKYGSSGPSDSVICGEEVFRVFNSSLFVVI